MSVSICANAEGNPGIAIPSVTLDQITSFDGSALPEGFTIEKLPESESSKQVEALHQKIAAALEAKTDMSGVFANPKGTDSAQIPLDIDDMMICEFIPLVIKGTAPENKAVEILLTVPGEYVPEDHVQSFIGIFMNNEVIWIPLTTEIIGEQIQVVFSPEALQYLGTENEAVLVLLRDIE